MDGSLITFQLEASARKLCTGGDPAGQGLPSFGAAPLEVSACHSELLNAQSVKLSRGHCILGSYIYRYIDKVFYEELMLYILSSQKTKIYISL